MAAALSITVRTLRDARITWALVAIPAAFFILSAAGLPTSALVLDTDFDTTVARPWTIITTAFISTGPLQWSINTILLAAVGAWHERWRGPLPTLAIFLAGVLAGSVSFVVVGAFLSETQLASVTLTGCSAGIFALAGALLKPGHMSIAATIAIVELSGLAGPNPGGSFAHLAGFAIGLLLGRPQAKSPDTAVNPSRQSAIDKAAQSGFASLSQDERAIIVSSKVSTRK